jgi:hypothetical protein
MLSDSEADRDLEETSANVSELIFPLGSVSELAS